MNNLNTAISKYIVKYEISASSNPAHSLTNEVSREVEWRLTMIYKCHPTYYACYINLPWSADYYRDTYMYSEYYVPSTAAMQEYDIKVFAQARHRQWYRLNDYCKIATYQLRNEDCAELGGSPLADTANII
jgi:hypothetical protein